MGRADQRATVGRLTRGSSLNGEIDSIVMYRARLDGPLIVLFEQDDADQPEDGVVMGKMPTTSVRRVTSPLTRSIGWCCGAGRDAPWGR